MSGEGRDSTYKSTLKTTKGPVRESRRLKKQVDYSEVELVLSDSDSEGTIFNSESGIESIKLEPGITELGLECERSVDVCTPGMLRSTANQVSEQSSRFTEVNTELAMAREAEKTGIERMMELMLQMRAEDRKEAQLREERREREERQREVERLDRVTKLEAQEREREAKREEEREAREARLLTTLRAAQPAVPQNVSISKLNLPKMKDTDDPVVFIRYLETALVRARIPQDQWKDHVQPQITLQAGEKIIEVLENEDSTFEDIKAALTGVDAMSFASTAEALFKPVKGGEKPVPRQLADRLKSWVKKLIQEAKTEAEIVEKLTVAFLRSKLSQELKEYLDLIETSTIPKYLIKIDEWEKCRAEGKPIYKQEESSRNTYKAARDSIGFKKLITCFHCGKVGHVSRDCRARLAKELLTPTIQNQGASPAPVPPTTSKPDRKPIICFVCHQPGHKSPQCPKKVAAVKRIQIPISQVVSLKQNEVFGKVEGHFLPITCDSGADITVVPEECVGVGQLTGETCTVTTFNRTKTIGKKCVVSVQVGGREFSRTAVTQPGEDIFWTACLSIDFSNQEETKFLIDQVNRKKGLEEEETSYMPPWMESGTFHPAVVVSDGAVVGVVEDTSLSGTLEPDPHSEEGKAELKPTDVEGVLNREDEREQSLASELNPSVLVEEGGERSGGSADRGVQDDLDVENIMANEPRSKLIQATKTDDSLTTARLLADSQSEGYHWQDGLVFRTRLDKLGDSLEQLCLPGPYRGKCLTMAHEHFGHMGRNKMGDHIRKYFYWPSITADSMKHIKSCERCQRADKTGPRRMQMQEREVVTIPSERVAIDLVGPFPVARGGFRYLLTYLDMATRWPEAIPLRKTTTRIVIEQLTKIFSRCGFPTTIISDNGPQFVAKSFEKWLREKGIAHVRASPYHPQGNGVVERMHRTLNGVIAKCVESKGNWASVVPMALYFLRCMPSTATGLSPFRVKHGWEPTTPLQILYKGWVQQDLGPVDLEEWTLLNAERVQHMRDVAVANLKGVSSERKKGWDRKSQTRVFDRGDKVYMRKAGLNTKLANSWEGPFTIERRNSPLSYRVNTGDRVIPSVHIQLLKEFIPREDEPRVNRVTSVLQPDTVEDRLDDQYAEAKISGSVVDETRARDIASWEADFRDILTKEPGLTHLKEFCMDTGDHPPIHQRPYNTPQSLVASVNKELAWLKSKGYIRPSESPWSSPMVTVRKPDGSARLCVDFKAINAVTQPIPFYMPRVEEVLESVGKSCVISKLDLTKGYYQASRHPQDCVYVPPRSI